MHHASHALRAHLLAAAIAAVPLLAPAADAAAQDPTQMHAAPLGRALSTFASERGIALSFDPALTAGRQAGPLRAGAGDREGLEQLLAGSGLRLLQRADGSYTLAPAPAGDSGVIPLAPLRIGAQRTFPYSEGMVMDQDEIEASIKGNGDLATLLRINPAVQFSDTARLSRNMGEIRPADISINGAAYYQNLFLLDGASFNNDIDPATNIDTSLGTVAANHATDVPSSSQGIALDTDLIERLTVYDSNVPVAYGGFNGGVVDARSRHAGDRFAGKVWWRMARSAWDSVIVPEGAEESFAQSSTYFRQLNYDKQTFGARLEGRSEAGIGLIGSVVQTRSEIPLRGYASGNVSENDSLIKTQTRKNTAYTLAADWQGDSGLELGANLAYAPSDDRYFIQNQKNAWFDLKSGGPLLSVRANLQRGAWSFNNTLSYSDMESSRSSEVDYYKVWAKSEQYNWGVNNSSIEGSWGNVDQHDRKLGYRFTASREALTWGRSEHRLEFGASYQDRKASYERMNDHVYYLQPYATTSCTLANGSTDSDSCSLSPVLTTSGNVVAGRGQYFRRQMLYHAGAFTVRGTEMAAWVQDDIALGDVNIRPGLRLDDDDIWNKTTFAPRLAASWDVFGNRDSVVTAGLNRYYGRNFFSYLLREGRERLLETKIRTSASTSWDEVTGSYTASTNRIADVDIPYTNEWTLGLDQQLAGLQINLKYVHRDNRDEVRRQSVRSNDDSGYYANNVYEYTNNGHSKAQTWTLSVGPQHPLKLWSTSTDVRFAFDHTDVRRNYTDYDSAWSESSQSERVRYKGGVYSLYDLPATNFNRPWTARLSTQTRIDALGLVWSNFLRYRAGFRDIVVTGTEEYQGETIDVYEDYDYKHSWIVDSALEYTFRFSDAQQAYVRVEANNVLNRRTIISGSSSTAYYEPGRSFWLELGYRF